MLCECLYRAFSSDVQQSLDIDTFISSYAVLFSNDPLLKKKFLFRIYENGSGYIERRRIEELLQIAYGDKLKGHYNSVTKVLDSIFLKKKNPANPDSAYQPIALSSQVISKAKFEQWSGKFDLLLEWVIDVLYVFIEPSPPNINYLQRMYSPEEEEESLKSRFHLHSIDNVTNLRYLFASHASRSMVGKSEIPLVKWKSWVCPDFLSPILAHVVFCSTADASVQQLPSWKFMNFAEFALIFGMGNLEVKANAIATSFIKYAVFQRTSASSSSLPSVTSKVTPPVDQLDYEKGADNYVKEKLPVKSLNPDFDSWIAETLTCMIIYLAQPLEVCPLSEDFAAPFLQFSRDAFGDDSVDSPERMPLVDENEVTQTAGESSSKGISDIQGEADAEDVLEIHKASSGTGIDVQIHGNHDNCELVKRQSVTRKSKKNGNYSLNIPAEPRLRSSLSTGKQKDSDKSKDALAFSLFPMTLSEIPHRFIDALPSVIMESLQEIFKNPSQKAEHYVALIVHYSSLLPGLRDLSITSCCLFGVEPVSAVEEKEFITELTLRYLKLYPPSSPYRPYGPIGTEWFVIPKAWIDSWRMFVGKNRGESTIESDGMTIGNSMNNLPSNSASSHSPWSTSSSSASRHSLVQKLDNSFLLKHRGSKALKPGLILGQDFEVVPPSVYTAFSYWYDGGPAVSRRVVSIAAVSEELGDKDDRMDSGSSVETGRVVSTDRRRRSRDVFRLSLSGEDSMLSSSSALATLSTLFTEIEFYPLCIFIADCDQYGKITGQLKEMLFSKRISIQDVILELSHLRNISSSKIRLWNYAKPFWKDQYILSPEITMKEADIQDGQTVLLELSGADGSWPRSQLHTVLDNEEKQRGAGADIEREVEVEAEAPQSVPSSVEIDDKKEKKVTRLNRLQQLKKNDGLVGLDNLGNTCYLNSSLQALLHTDLLVEYFLSKTFQRHINSLNKHGYGGKLANVFGRIVYDLWSTTSSCITPRYVYNEIATLRDQFAGNEQHDSHELLAFLLDGLSEDLNLVHSKPYTVQPDSEDGKRSDEQLAKIWWENHLKRDRSVIQALFTGQFKSMMICSNPSGCAYSSARFEPFTFLTVPIPEDPYRVIKLQVITRNLSHACECAVRVNKTGIVEDIIEQIKLLGSVDGILPPDSGNDTLKISLNEEAHGESDGFVQVEDTEAVKSMGTNSIVSVPPFFVVGELTGPFDSRIKSFINLDRRIDTIRESETLVVFHVTGIPRKMERYYYGKYPSMLKERLEKEEKMKKTVECTGRSSTDASEDVTDLSIHKPNDLPELNVETSTVENGPLSYCVEYLLRDLSHQYVSVFNYFLCLFYFIYLFIYYLFIYYLFAFQLCL
jgi:hypothetical protein